LHTVSDLAIHGGYLMVNSFGIACIYVYLSLSLVPTYTSMKNIFQKCIEMCYRPVKHNHIHMLCMAVVDDFTSSHE